MAALTGGTAGEGADDASKEEGPKRFFDEFHPFLLKQHEDKQYIT